MRDWEEQEQARIERMRERKNRQELMKETEYGLCYKYQKQDVPFTN